jgi:RNA polymerase sigma-70 factor (ECF subfamily)
LLLKSDIAETCLIGWLSYERIEFSGIGSARVPGEVSKMETKPSLLVRIRDPLDEEAWRTFMALYAPLIYRFGRRWGLQDADAADLTQEVLGEVMSGIRSFEYRPERGRFRDWLLLITRRRLARIVGLKARLPKPGLGSGIPDPVDESSPNPEWDEAFNERVLRVALRRIRPHFSSASWRAFERVWMEHRPATEAADELSMSVEAVYMAKSRILKRLEEEVRDIAEDFSWLDAIEAT